MLLTNATELRIIKVLCNLVAFSFNMKKKTSVQTKIQVSGRPSKIRQLLFDIFSMNHKPLSVAELLSSLEEKGTEVNKTTVYREIQSLLEKQVVNAVFVDETHTKYELNINHHHHLVCKGCGEIEEVEFDSIEKIFPLFEKKLKQKKKFQSITHTLEFFGVCQNCA